MQHFKPMIASRNNIKKESPNEGTETSLASELYPPQDGLIKKESPNEGTETAYHSAHIFSTQRNIKKESPNEGTETSLLCSTVRQ